jgi:hypothetical protein
MATPRNHIETAVEYWIEGGSLAEYLRKTSPGNDAVANVQFIKHKRIHRIQKA